MIVQIHQLMKTLIEVMKGQQQTNNAVIQLAKNANNTTNYNNCVEIKILL